MSCNECGKIMQHSRINLHHSEIEFCMHHVFIQINVRFEERKEF